MDKIIRNIKMLKTLKSNPNIKKLMDEKYIEISWGGMWWNSYDKLKKSCEDDLRYMIRCRHSIYR